MFCAAIHQHVSCIRVLINAGVSLTEKVCVWVELDPLCVRIAPCACRRRRRICVSDCSACPQDCLGKTFKEYCNADTVRGVEDVLSALQGKPRSPRSPRS